MLRIYKKKPYASIAQGKKDLKTSYFFQNSQKNMDIFFFFYSIIYGLPRGVLEVPRGV